MSPPTSNTILRLALPTGRLRDGVLELLGDAGIRTVCTDRVYRARASLADTDVKLLKPQNVVAMLQCGARDVGSAGADWVAELDANDVVELLDTGSNPVRIVAAAPRAIADRWSARALDPRRVRVATEYERLARTWLDASGRQGDIVRSFGTTQVFPPEDADVIVDNTATGSTLAANGLMIIDELIRSSTRLYASRTALADPFEASPHRCARLRHRSRPRSPPQRRHRNRGATLPTGRREIATATTDDDSLPVERYTRFPARPCRAPGLADIVATTPRVRFE